MLSSADVVKIANKDSSSFLNIKKRNFKKKGTKTSLKRNSLAV